MALSTGEATIVVTPDVLREIVEGSGGLTLPSDAAIVYGNFRINEGGELEFCILWDACDNHPDDWAKQPEWRKGLIK